jgi:hypothetical protein
MGIVQLMNDSHMIGQGLETESTSHVFALSMTVHLSTGADGNKSSRGRNAKYWHYLNQYGGPYREAEGYTIDQLPAPKPPRT